MSEPLVRVDHYTDPGCPFAFSAEPHRIKVQWTYGDQVRLRTRLIVLSDSPEELAAKGFTTEKIAHYYGMLHEQYGMPITDQPFPRLHHTRPACELVAGVRRRQPDLADRVLRELRRLTMAGNLLDDADTLERAAARAGLDPAEALAWAREPETLAELQEDWLAAREPGPVSVGALRHKLSALDAGAVRYSAPSWVASGRGMQLEIPGMQPYAAYELALANLAPDLVARDAPSSVVEALEWAHEAGIGPLATVEVAALIGAEADAARAALQEGGAQFETAGLDGYWSLTTAGAVAG